MLRRDFLKLTTVATAGVFVPRFGQWYRQAGPPILWGDGVHDDSAALQWRIDHAAQRGHRFVLTNGIYRIDRTLVLRDEFAIDRVVFHGERIFADPLLRVSPDRTIRNSFLTNNCLYGSSRCIEWE